MGKYAEVILGSSPSPSLAPASIRCQSSSIIAPCAEHRMRTLLHGLVALCTRLSIQEGEVGHCWVLLDTVCPGMASGDYFLFVVLWKSLILIKFLSPDLNQHSSVFVSSRYLIVTNNPGPVKVNSSFKGIWFFFNLLPTIRVKIYFRIFFSSCIILSWRSLY